MASLWIKFQIDLIDSKTYRRGYFTGPIFSRFIPNPERDAIIVPIPDPNVEFRLWFDIALRSAYITEDEETDDLMYLRGDKPYDRVMGAGSLIGRLEFKHVPSDVFQAIAAGRNSDPEYVAFAGDIVERMICPKVCRLVDLLRTRYGQFWLRPFLPWSGMIRSNGYQPFDRDEALGWYCWAILHSNYSVDEGETWKAFAPGGFEGPIEDQFHKYGGHRLKIDEHGSEYLSHEDWHDLPKFLQSNLGENIAAKILIRAHEMRHSMDLTVLLSFVSYGQAMFSLRRAEA